MTSKPTPEDLINLVIEADDLRRRGRGLSSTRAARRTLGSQKSLHIEPFFNALGAFWARLIQILPAFYRRPLIQWLNTKMGHYEPKEAPKLAERISETLQLARDVRRTSGTWPALL